jgi:hypothetical protein
VPVFIWNELYILEVYISPLLINTLITFNNGLLPRGSPKRDICGEVLLDIMLQTSPLFVVLWFLFLNHVYLPKQKNL